MLRNYFSTAYRNLKRHKGFSFINILGLAIGMAACLLILQYVTFQFTFDAVACLGLFGLASFTTTQRTKEISIRKVLGASNRDVMGLLNKDLLQLILLSNLIAWPLAYWAISKWLEEYTFGIEMNVWLFLLPALLVLIALLVVSVQTIKAARANPVNP